MLLFEVPMTINFDQQFDIFWLHCEERLKGQYDFFGKISLFFLRYIYLEMYSFILHVN